MPHNIPLIDDPGYGALPLNPPILERQNACVVDSDDDDDRRNVVDSGDNMADDDDDEDDDPRNWEPMEL